MFYIIINNHKFDSSMPLAECRVFRDEDDAVGYFIERSEGATGWNLDEVLESIDNEDYRAVYIARSDEEALEDYKRPDSFWRNLVGLAGYRKAKELLEEALDAEGLLDDE